mmetsp:Transcript_2946/g.7484  ORF Transcript_2946/g.7484 Transcript_2946/m.7484 type:complete len:95 (+) Transcript_2946:604-888(+)
MMRSVQTRVTSHSLIILLMGVSSMSILCACVSSLRGFVCVDGLYVFPLVYLRVCVPLRVLIGEGLCACWGFQFRVACFSAKGVERRHVLTTFSP